MPVTLPLPIAGRRTCEYLSDQPSTPSTADDETCHVTAKNTVVDVLLDDSDEEWGAMESRGSKSCVARLMEPAAWPQGLAEQWRQCSETETLDGDDIMRQLTYSESTPWGETQLDDAARLFPASSDARLFPASSEHVPTSAAPAVGPVPQRQIASVTLQIPLQVCCDHPLVAGTAVEGSYTVDVNEEDGQTVIRLCVKSVRDGAVKLASGPRVCPVEAPETSPAADIADAGHVPSPPVARRRAGAHGRKAAGAPGKSEKSHMVCCHWKNRGWCKFQDTCRFQHPEDRRGAGLVERASAALATMAAQQQVAPCAFAAHFGAGLTGQGQAAPSLPALWQPARAGVMMPSPTTLSA